MKNYILSLKSNKALTCSNIQFLLIATLLILLPFSTVNAAIGTLSILIFLCSFKEIKSNYKNMFHEKSILILFLFIFFTYLSILWSEMPLAEGDFNTNFDRFKYYFLLIPGIYFSNISKSRIFNLLLIMAFSPFLIALIYYTNAIGITELYSPDNPLKRGEFEFFNHYLIVNFFLLTSSIYFYIKIFSSVKQKKLKEIIFYIFSFLFFSISLFIDEYANTRLINLGLFVILIIVPLFHLKLRGKIISLILVVSLFLGYIYTNKNIQKGIDKLTTSALTDQYTGSWGARLAFAKIGLIIFYENPMLGVSINDVSSEIIRIKKEEPKYYCDKTIRIHNGHINFLAQIGLIGYLFFLFVIYNIFSIKILNKDVYIFKQVLLITLMFIMFGEHYFSLKATSNYIAVIFGLLILFSKYEREEYL